MNLYSFGIISIVSSIYSVPKSFRSLKSNLAEGKIKGYSELQKFVAGMGELPAKSLQSQSIMKSPPSRLYGRAGRTRPVNLTGTPGITLGLLQMAFKRLMRIKK